MLRPYDVRTHFRIRNMDKSESSKEGANMKVASTTSTEGGNLDGLRVGEIVVTLNFGPAGKLQPPPEHAKKGNEWRPWLKMTERDMSVMRRRGARKLLGYHQRPRYALSSSALDEAMPAKNKRGTSLPLVERNLLMKRMMKTRLP